MVEERFKRNVAYKLRIGDLLIGKPIINEGRFSFLELGDKKIVRVNIIGNVVDKYESEGRNEGKKYVFLTIDDGSGQTKLKVFGDDYEKFKNIIQGQTVAVIGVLRHWNDETYISPEIIREENPKYLLLRKLETEKDKTLNVQPIEKAQIIAIKDRILEMIKNSEEEGGVKTEKIIQKFSEIPQTIIDQEIQKLLEEGIVFEPLPGKIRWLG